MPLQQKTAVASRILDRVEQLMHRTRASSADVQHDLAEHLRYLQELGVTGVSRDPAWRRARIEHRDGGPRAASRDTAASACPQPVPRGKPDADASRVFCFNSRTRSVLPVTRCKLHTLGRKQVVFGVGNPERRPDVRRRSAGRRRGRQGEPFVGRAGQLLTKIIEAIGLKREEVYIANVIKCRPPGNRNPEPDEVEQCEPFLFRQIDAIKPKVIVALGKFAAQSLLKTTDPITRLRGRVFNYRGASLIPTFHPAYPAAQSRRPSARSGKT